MYIPAAATSLLVLFSMHGTRLSPASCVFVASQRLYSRACYIVYDIILLCTVFCMWYAVAEIDCCFRKSPIASAVVRINCLLRIPWYMKSLFEGCTDDNLSFKPLLQNKSQLTPH